MHRGSKTRGTGSERQGSKRTGRPQRDDRRSQREERPVREERSPRRERTSEGGERSPRRPQRDSGRPQRDSGRPQRDSGRPQRDSGRPSRFQRDEQRPSRFSRDEQRPQRFSRDTERPSRDERRPFRPARPPVDERRPSRPERSSRPECPVRPVRPTREAPRSEPRIEREIRKPLAEKKAFVPHEFFVWGRRAVEAYLAKLVEEKDADPKRYALHMIVDKTGKAPSQLRTSVELAKTLGLPVHAHKNVEEGWPLTGDEELNHQRVCLRVPEIKLEDIGAAIEEIAAAKERGAQGCIGVILDQVQDPRNFGAILRSAAFFGQKFVLFASDRQAAITPHVLKTSAGGAFQLKLIEVVNLNRALEKLKNAGAWIVGTTLKDAEDLAAVPKDRPYVVILGNESRGLRQEIARHCDYLAKITGGVGPVESLNVSVAAGVVLHALADVGAQLGEIDVE